MLPTPLPMLVPIYTLCGGAEVVDPAITDWLFRVRMDRDLALWWGRATGTGGCPEESLRHFVTTALGGPGEWTGPLLEPAHAGRGITNTAFARFGGHLLHALGARGVHPEILGLVVQVLEPLRAHIVTAPTTAEETTPC